MDNCRVTQTPLFVLSIAGKPKHAASCVSQNLERAERGGDVTPLWHISMPLCCLVEQQSLKPLPPLSSLPLCVSLSPAHENVVLLLCACVNKAVL